jgi:hypothetical protein
LEVTRNYNLNLKLFKIMAPKKVVGGKKGVSINLNLILVEKEATGRGGDLRA